jgi:hypothetical protein
VLAESLKPWQRRAPDLTGPAGEAWDLPLRGNMVSSWLVHCPSAHPLWKWWTVCVVDLRNPRTGWGSRKAYPGAEFEFVIAAVDPYACPEPDPALWGEGYTELVPADVVKQFHGVTDEQARHLTATAVQAILAELLSPDEDQRKRWVTSIETMVKSLRSR